VGLYLILKYGNTKEATLSVWRPRYIREDGEEIEIPRYAIFYMRMELKLTLGRHFGLAMGLLKIQPTSYVSTLPISRRTKY
jgi:hypothetical protein